MPINRDRNSYHLWHPFTNMKTFFDESIVFVEGKGARIKDIDGNEYINGMSSLWNVHCGLGRQEIIDAISGQLSKLAFCSITRAANLPAIELADKLAEITPEKLNRVFLTSTGSAAIEASVMMIRQYAKLKGTPEKYQVISLEDGYHGVSAAAMSASGVKSMQRLFEPLLPGFHHIPPPYCYRCRYSKTYPDCGLRCAAELERTILRLGPENIGAFLLEPVMAFAGGIIPPDGYLTKIREICDTYDVKLIFDEITTGFGRLGAMFAADYWDVRPDIMALSKGINSGYLPLGAVMCTDEIYEAFLAERPGSGTWSWADSGIFSHGSTSDGHPVCCASALANIDIIQKEKLPENAKEIGGYLLSRMKEFLKFSFVGEVRGLGLLIAVELVEDKADRTPLSSDSVFMISTRLLKSGLFAYCMGNCITLFPPLIFTREDADETYTIFSKTFQKVERMMS